MLGEEIVIVRKLFLSILVSTAASTAFAENSIFSVVNSSDVTIYGIGLYGGWGTEITMSGEIKPGTLHRTDFKLDGKPLQTNSYDVRYVKEDGSYAPLYRNYGENIGTSTEYVEMANGVSYNVQCTLSSYKNGKLYGACSH